MTIIDHNRPTLTIIDKNQPTNHNNWQNKLNIFSPWRIFFGNTIDLTIAWTKFLEEELTWQLPRRKLLVAQLTWQLPWQLFWKNIWLDNCLDLKISLRSMHSPSFAISLLSLALPFLPSPLSLVFPKTIFVYLLSHPSPLFTLVFYLLDLPLHLSNSVQDAAVMQFTGGVFPEKE